MLLYSPKRLASKLSRLSIKPTDFATTYFFSAYRSLCDFTQSDCGDSTVSQAPVDGKNDWAVEESLTSLLDRARWCLLCKFGLGFPSCT